MSHTSLVAHESSQVHRLLGVILNAPIINILPSPRSVVDTHLGERLYFSAVTCSTLSWEETKRAVTGFFILLIENIRIVCSKTAFLSADLTVTRVEQ